MDTSSRGFAFAVKGCYDDGNNDRLLQTKSSSSMTTTMINFSYNDDFFFFNDNNTHSELGFECERERWGAVQGILTLPFFQTWQHNPLIPLCLLFSDGGLFIFFFEGDDPHPNSNLIWMRKRKMGCDSVYSVVQRMLSLHFFFQIYTIKNIFSLHANRTRLAWLERSQLSRGSEEMLMRWLWWR